MKEFGNLEALAEHLMLETVGGLKEVKHGVALAAEVLDHESKKEIGTYQAATGPFEAWEELAPSTKTDRLRQGYTENDPGLRDGTMRNSIEHEAKDWEADIGSDDQNLVWFELGTSKQPPRPVFGTALHGNIERVVKLIGDTAVSGFLGNAPLKPELGYSVGDAEG